MRALMTIALVLASTPVFAGSTRVQGYINNNGTYVAPHYRTTPDNTYTNNYSYQGNTNPYTGTTGTRTYNNQYNSLGGIGSNNNGSSYNSFGGGRKTNSWGN